ncbi:MAG: hypothetical protein ACSHW0_07880 [Thalassotalea sp.]
MAVINCPSCKKKISDKAKSCSHCQLELSNLDDEKLSSLAQVNNIKKSQQIMTFAFIAMLLFCGGFLFLYWSNAEVGSWQYSTAMVTTGIGFFWYLVTRIQLIILKRSKK